MQAILLAAGYGTRLQPYTRYRPKPLFPVLNRPLLLRLRQLLVAAGCTRLVVNCHHLAEQIRQALRPYADTSLQYEPEILGTGGSLRKAASAFSDHPILVMNGDIYHDIDLQHLYACHCSNSYKVTMAMHDLPRFNTVTVEEERIRSFAPDSRGTKRAFTGIHVVDKEVLALIPASGFYHIIDLYEQLAAAGKVGMHRVDHCFWQDIGTPADYLGLHGRLLTDSKGRQTWTIASSAMVAADAELTGWGAIGANAIIGQGAQVQRSVVWDHAVIPPGAVVQDAIVVNREQESK